MMMWSDLEGRDASHPEPGGEGLHERVAPGDGQPVAWPGAHHDQDQDHRLTRVAESWKRWKHVSSHFRILAATFGWLGQRLSQPTNFGSHISLPFNCLLTGWARGLASQMAGTQPNGCDSAKWLWFSQMTRNQPNGCSSAIWMGLSQVAGTQPNGCDSAKKLGISPKTGK